VPHPAEPFRSLPSRGPQPGVPRRRLARWPHPAQVTVADERPAVADERPADHSCSALSPSCGYAVGAHPMG